VRWIARIWRAYFFAVELLPCGASSSQCLSGAFPSAPFRGSSSAGVNPGRRVRRGPYNVRPAAGRVASTVPQPAAQPAALWSLAPLHRSCRPGRPRRRPCSPAALLLLPARLPLRLHPALPQRLVPALHEPERAAALLAAARQPQRPAVGRHLARQRGGGAGEELRAASNAVRGAWEGGAGAQASAARQPSQRGVVCDGGSRQGEGRSPTPRREQAPQAPQGRAKGRGRRCAAPLALPRAAAAPSSWGAGAQGAAPGRAPQLPRGRLSCGGGGRRPTLSVTKARMGERSIMPSGGRMPLKRFR
jgi:hypothetical protein